ncbi:MAG: hypothetical protein EP343_10090 [Deltaproteobacteria bacterium]|nr:MAG: hypothetical protein EP343_10090 [Deltaproteobacteria bacterium]
MRTTAQMFLLSLVVLSAAFLLDCSGPICNSSADCLYYLTCRNGQCVAKDCDVGTRACDGFTCTDLQTDNFNCGQCGIICNNGLQCVRGECKSFCPDGRAVCGDTCPDIKTDNQHCGQCFNSCSSTQTCIEGKCQCFSNLEQCGRECVDTFSNQFHCGVCFKTCSSTQRCSQGVCIARE